jgi:hypothetical protein
MPPPSKTRRPVDAGPVTILALFLLLLLLVVAILGEPAPAAFALVAWAVVALASGR